MTTPHHRLSPSERGSTPSSVDHEPDYRFTLANERTFLAWVRTALAMLAAGVAVGQIFVVESHRHLHQVVGLVCVAMAASLAVGAFLRWRQVQAAMRRDAPLPSSLLVRGVVAGFGCAVTAVIVLVVR